MKQTYQSSIFVFVLLLNKIILLPSDKKTINDIIRQLYKSEIAGRDGFLSPKSFGAQDISYKVCENTM
jgi:hypothetical protein